MRKRKKGEQTETSCNDLVGIYNRRRKLLFPKLSLKYKEVCCWQRNTRQADSTARGKSHMQTKWPLIVVTTWSERWRIKMNNFSDDTRKHMSFEGKKNVLLWIQATTQLVNLFAWQNYNFSPKWSNPFVKLLPLHFIEGL